MAKHIQMPPTYPIPNNWTWVELRKLTKIISGYPFDSKLFSDLGTEGRPLIRIRDVVRGYTETYTTEDCPEQYFIHKNDILIGMDGDFNVGRWQDETALLNQRVCYIQSTSDLLLNDYLFYFLPTPLKQINDVTPSVTVKHLSTKTIESIMIPLPPVEEQIRLCELIQSLFAKLDEAKEKAQDVLDGFETRKAAILHKAFSGELTAKWREENHIDQNWSLTLLEKIAERIFDGPFGSNLKSEDYVSSGIRVVRLENLKNLWFDDSKQSFVSQEKYDTISKHTVYPSDLIMSTFIADETKVCQMPKHIPYAINKADCIAIRLKTNVNKRFVLYYLSSKFVFDMLQNQIHGATRPRVNSKQIKSIAIKMPSVSEQNEIVRILDRMYDSELKAMETAKAVIEQIDTMKKAILARAFRGDLGTNDPSEESAVELLKKIL